MQSLQTLANKCSHCYIELGFKIWTRPIPPIPKDEADPWKLSKLGVNVWPSLNIKCRFKLENIDPKAKDEFVFYGSRKTSNEKISRFTKISILRGGVYENFSLIPFFPTKKVSKQPFPMHNWRWSGVKSSTEIM